MERINQLPLALIVENQYTLDNFYAGENQQIITSLQASLTELNWCTMITAPQGHGKTHLLQGLCAEWPENSSIYLPMKYLINLDPQLVDEVEQYRQVVIDDIDQVHTNVDWQQALFHLYNRLQAIGHRLVCSTTIPPQQLELSLKDLHSRLLAAHCYTLLPLSDSLKIQLLTNYAKKYGMVIAPPILAYIFRYWSREINDCLGLIDRLDQVTLAHKRRVTLPLVKQLLAN